MAIAKPVQADRQAAGSPFAVAGAHQRFLAIATQQLQRLWRCPMAQGHGNSVGNVCAISLGAGIEQHHPLPDQTPHLHGLEGKDLRLCNLSIDAVRGAPGTVLISQDRLSAAFWLSGTG